MSGESSRTAARTAPVGSAQAPRSQFRLLGKRRFLPFFCTQLLGAFNDNVFKQALILAILFKIGTGADKSLLINLCALLFILPFFLFSALGGQFGERFEKAWLIRRIKFAETFSGQNNNVDVAQFGTRVPEGLTCHTLDTIAINRVANTFPGYHQSQPCMLQIIVSGQQQYAGT